MATYENSAYSSWDSKSYSWGTGKTRCWVGTWREYPDDTTVRVRVHGCVQCDSTYRLAQYGVHVRVGHDGGNTTPAWGVSDHRGDAVFDGTNAWQPPEYCTSYDDFQRKSTDYTVTFYCDYWGETVNGYGGCSNTGKATVTVTIPALEMPDITVSYNANGGTGTMSSHTAVYGQSFAVKNCTFTRSGYKFVGWTSNSNGTADGYGWSSADGTPWSGTWTWVDGTYGISNNQLTLYAMWEAVASPDVEYTITYNANGGTGAPANQTKTKDKNITLSTVQPTRANVNGTSYTVTYNYNSGTGSPASATATSYTQYTFKNWNTTSNGSGTPYNSGATYSANADITLYAQWNSTTVRGVVVLPTPTRNGYTFGGWYSDSSLITKVGDAGAIYTPTRAVTLYAKWTENPATSFTVAYNANGGTGAPNPQTKTKGVALTLSTTKPTRSNSTTSYTVTYNHNYTGSSNATATATTTTSYTFNNWNTAANGGGTSYSSGGRYTTDADVTLYAQWTETKSGGSVTLRTPTRSGYTFGGWYSNSSCTIKVGDAGASYTPTGNITLYAKWTQTPMSYTVSYDANGGTGAPQNQTKTHGTALTLSSTKPTRNNSTTSYTVTYNHNYTGSSNTTATATTTTSYTFNNWNTSANGNGTSYASGARYTTNADLKLYAQWNTSSSGGNVTLPLPTRNGYTFGGWYGNSGLTTKVGNAEDSYTPTENVTLYAKWIKSYTITYNANGGNSNSVPASQAKDENINITLSSTKPTRNNSTSNGYTITYNYNGGSGTPSSITGQRTTSYTFKNWNTSSNGSGTSYNSGATYSANANATLYAQWNSTTVNVPVELPTPARSGYTFDGWYSNSTLTTKAGDAGAYYTPSSNITLYAKWTQNALCVITAYDSNGIGHKCLITVYDSTGKARSCNITPFL